MAEKQNLGTRMLPVGDVNIPDPESVHDPNEARGFRPMSTAGMNTFCGQEFGIHLGPWARIVSRISYLSIAMSGVDQTESRASLFMDIPRVAEAFSYLMKRADLDVRGDERTVIEGDDQWLEYWKYLQKLNGSQIIDSKRHPVKISTDLLMERWVYWLHYGYFSRSGKGSAVLSHPSNRWDRRGVDLVIYSADGSLIPVGAFDIKNGVFDGDLHRRGPYIRPVRFIEGGNDYTLHLFKLYVGRDLGGLPARERHMRHTAWRAAETVVSTLAGCPLVLPDDSILATISEILYRFGRNCNIYGDEIKVPDYMQQIKKSFIRA